VALPVGIPSSGCPSPTTTPRVDPVRSEVDHPIGGLDDIEVVLDGQHRVALVDQTVQDV